MVTIYRKASIILGIILFIALPLYAEGDTEPHNSQSSNEKYATFSDWINSRNYAIHMDEKEDEELLREEWKQALGLDVFYPYFKAKEVRDNTENRSSTKFLRLRGRAKLQSDEAKYIFNMKF